MPPSCCRSRSTATPPPCGSATGSRATSTPPPAGRSTPAKLTWVEHSTHDLARGRVEFRLIPDHYRDRFRASGPAAIEPGPGGDGAHRTVTGSLSIKAPLVGRLVENAVVSGLRDHLSGEATAVDRFLAG